MERGSVRSETHQFFKMEDFDVDPALLLVEMNYLLEMFNLETLNKKDKPIVITLREKSEHFKQR